MNRLRESFYTDDPRSGALLEVACGYIDRIHRVAGTANYAFYVDDLPPGVYGQHFIGEAIYVSRNAARQLLVCFHEFGHALDGTFLNSIRSYESVQNPLWRSYASDLAQSDSASLLGDWLEAVRGSAYHTALLNALAEPTVTPAQASEIQKLLSVRELWARSYEMFIAYRAGEDMIAKHMDLERSLSVRIGGVQAYNYWQGRDFEQIERCVHDIFDRLGWLI